MNDLKIGKLSSKDEVMFRIKCMYLTYYVNDTNRQNPSLLQSSLFYIVHSDTRNKTMKPQSASYLIFLITQKCKIDLRFCTIKID